MAQTRKQAQEPRRAAQASQLVMAEPLLVGTQDFGGEATEHHSALTRQGRVQDISHTVAAQTYLCFL